MGYSWDQLKKDARKVNEKYAPGVNEAMDVVNKKKTVKEVAPKVLADTAQDALLPVTRQMGYGNVYDEVINPALNPSRKGPKSPEITPEMRPQNLWPEMRNKATMDYNNASFGYNPYETSAGPELRGMNYNPYKTAARNAAQSDAGLGLVSHQSQLQQQGGLSAADRMRSFSDFNRAKITGQLQGAAKYDQAQSQSNLDAARFNAERQSRVNQINVGSRNDASRDLGFANARRQENLYNQSIAQRDLDNQLAASKLLAERQLNQPTGRSTLDKVIDPANVVNNSNRKWLDPLGSHEWVRKQLGGRFS